MNTIHEQSDHQESHPLEHKNWNSVVYIGHSKS